jgi:glycosyltransferase involved in cell wall biosynthesis
MPFRDVVPKKLTPDEEIEILYCGNLGLMHDIETVVKALPFVGADGGSWRRFNFTFHAFGSLYSQFRREITKTRPGPSCLVRLADPLEDADWVIRMRRAQLALVTMKQGAEKVVMPSKAYSAMAAGQAIIAVCSPDSDLATMVREERCGWVVEPGQPEALLDVLREISRDTGGLLEKRMNAFKAGHGKYSAAAIADLWINLVSGLR